MIYDTDTTTKTNLHLKVDFGSIEASKSNSYNLTPQQLNKLKALPCPCVAFSQAFLFNSFRWLFLGKLDGNCFTVSLWTRDEKSVPMGGTPQSILFFISSHVMSLHQSSSPSVKPVARLVSAHSTLFRFAVQYGELSSSAGTVLRAPRGPIWPFEHVVAPSPAERLCERPVPTVHPRRVTRFCQDTAVGPSHCQKTGSRSPSP